jgi:3-oxoacyl-[acyl-carrier-protein] synthase-3
MRLSVPGVRIADVETCDFGLMPCHETEPLLERACPDTWERYLESSVSRRLMAELGVDRRHLTQVPGQAPEPGRLTAIDLARSAVERLRARRPGALERLDALIFVSTSNPNPCNSQAALLAQQVGIEASCLDLKAGCSGGVTGVAQAALLVQAGCERVLVVMAENLSQLTPADDLRALLTVGDGAACVLVERSEGAGFLSVLHGTAPEFAGAMAVRTPFPPAGPGARYVFEISDAARTREALRCRWRRLLEESTEAAGMRPPDLAQCFLHQTHRAQLDGLVNDLGLEPWRVPHVVHDHGNMGSPTFAVAMARRFERLAPGERYLMAAVGGGMSWCAIVAEHA